MLNAGSYPGFCSQVNNGIDLIQISMIADIPDVVTYQLKERMMQEAFDIYLLLFPCIKCIEIIEAVNIIPAKGKHPLYQVAADKACTPCNKNSFHVNWLSMFAVNECEMSKRIADTAVAKATHIVAVI